MNPTINPVFTSGSANNMTLPSGQIVDRTALDRNVTPNFNLAPTLSTNFPTPPQGTKKTPIVTSGAATDHVNKLGTAIGQSNADIQAANQAKAQQQNQPKPTDYGSFIPKEDLASFQKSNPGLTFTAEDYKNYLSAGKEQSNNSEDHLGTILANLTGEENKTSQPSATDQSTMDADQAQNTIDRENLATVNDAINQMNAGTYPLSPTEQASVANVATAFSGALSTAQQINQNKVGGQTVNNAKYGLQMYSPTEALSNIARIVQTGSQNIAKINTQMLDAQTKITQAFQDKDYKSATALATQLNDLIKNRTTEISDINKSVADAQKELDTQLENQRKDFFDQVTKPINDIATKAAENGADSKTIAAISSAKDVQSAINAAGQSLQKATGQLGDYLQYKRDATASGIVPQDYATWKQADDAQTAKEKANEAYGTAFATAKGKAAGEDQGTKSVPASPVTSPSGIIYNAPASVAPYVNFASNGVKYIDMSSFKGTPSEANAAIRDAQDAGYKVITNKNTALDVQNIADATAKLADIKAAFAKANAGNAVERNLYAAAFNTVAQKLQTDPNYAGINVYQDAALDILKAMSGVQGFRGGQSVVQQVKETFPSITDTATYANAKIDNLQKLITDRETALVGKPSASDQLLIDEKNNENNLTTNLNNMKTTNPKIYSAASAMFTTVDPGTGQPYTASDILQAFPELKQ